MRTLFLEGFGVFIVV